MGAVVRAQTPALYFYLLMINATPEQYKLLQIKIRSKHRFGPFAQTKLIDTSKEWLQIVTS
jgi:hypothetical protein